MSLTEDVLLNEKEKLFKAARESTDEFKFSAIDEEERTYYIPYGKSKHLKAELTEFSSSEFSEFIKSLDALWDAESHLDDVKRIIAASYYKTLNSEKKLIEDVDLYNYMI